MKICPENSAVDTVGSLEHVMMVVPVNAEYHEAEHVSQEHRQKWRDRGQVCAVWNLQLEHEDRDEDRKNPIAERFETCRAHCFRSVDADGGKCSGSRFNS